MAGLKCMCGEILSNTMCPNDVELRIFTDVEWDDVIGMGTVDTLELPRPKHAVWRCPICGRVYVFDRKFTQVIKYYVPHSLDELKDPPG